MTYKIVILSAVALYPVPKSAGERLVRELYTALEDQGRKPIILAPASPFQREYDSRVNQHLVRVDRRLAAYSKMGQFWGAWTPDIRLLKALLRDPRALELLRQAEIIDLQWASNFLLSPFIHRINPRARLIGTYHDISHQRLARRGTLQARGVKARLWRGAARASCILESVLTGDLETRVVLSEKDRSLLPRHRAEQVRVLLPPIVATGAVKTAAAQAPVILFVGVMYRWENDEAIRWFIEESLPLIWQQHPKATLQVVGIGPSTRLMTMANADPRITVTGYVEDLESYYAGAAVVIAPIRLGSGVKFKTLDAILRGLPVVATGAGAEGVANVEWISVLAHSARSFAQGVNRVLETPDYYRKKAEVALHEARATYSREAYGARVATVYEGLT